MPTSLWVSVPYVFGLSLITECLALLSFGLALTWAHYTRRCRPAGHHEYDATSRAA
jgi:hypothetical protein